MLCSLDNLLNGGLKETTVTEISGETCCGKTQVRQHSAESALRTTSNYQSTIHASSSAGSSVHAAWQDMVQWEGVVSHAIAPGCLAACLLQLCHLAAVMTAQRSERVYYFDTTNSFSASRLQQLSEASSLEVRPVWCD